MAKMKFNPFSSSFDYIGEGGGGAEVTAGGGLRIDENTGDVVLGNSSRDVVASGTLGGVTGATIRVGSSPLVIGRYSGSSTANRSISVFAQDSTSLRTHNNHAESLLSLSLGSAVMSGGDNATLAAKSVVDLDRGRATMFTGVPLPSGTWKAKAPLSATYGARIQHETDVVSNVPSHYRVRTEASTSNNATKANAAHIVEAVPPKDGEGSYSSISSSVWKPSTDESASSILSLGGLKTLASSKEMRANGGGSDMPLVLGRGSTLSKDGFRVTITDGLENAPNETDYELSANFDVSATDTGWVTTVKEYVDDYEGGLDEVSRTTGVRSDNPGDTGYPSTQVFSMIEDGDDSSGYIMDVNSNEGIFMMDAGNTMAGVSNGKFLAMAEGYGPTAPLDEPSAFAVGPWSSTSTVVNDGIWMRGNINIEAPRVNLRDMQGDSGVTLSGVANPVNAKDAANKEYVDTAASGAKGRNIVAVQSMTVPEDVEYIYASDQITLNLGTPVNDTRRVTVYANVDNVQVADSFGVIHTLLFGEAHLFMAHQSFDGPGFEWVNFTIKLPEE